MTSRSGSCDAGQALAVEAAGEDRGQAPLGLAARLTEVQDDEPVDQGALLVVEMAVLVEIVGNRPVLVASPRAECVQELVLVDQSVPEREEPEEQVAVDIDGGHEMGLLDLGRGGWRSVPEGGGLGPSREPDSSYYRMPDRTMHLVPTDRGSRAFDRLLTPGGRVRPSSTIKPAEMSTRYPRSSQGVVLSSGLWENLRRAGGRPCEVPIAYHRMAVWWRSRGIIEPEVQATSSRDR